MEVRSLNKMKGSLMDESPFYHSFGTFLKHNVTHFDPPTTSDFPMNMDYKGVEKLAQLTPSKFPHLRLVFKDQAAMKIAIKLICLNIRYSGHHNNNDRPRLTENCRFIIQDLF